MVFRDQNFCTSSKCSKFGKCWRSFTPEMEASANSWGKSFGLEPHEVPVDKRSYSNEKCYTPKDK